MKGRFEIRVNLGVGRALTVEYSCLVRALTAKTDSDFSATLHRNLPSAGMQAVDHPSCRL